MKTEYELLDVLLECFEKDVGTEKEELLHDDRYVTKKLKERLGSKLFKEYDALDKQTWKDAWLEFGTLMWKKRQNT
ncbi:hypothetical protein ACH6EH_07320 [Paenibacillus sp. JSM ZJ436]|uniref:hypothetical protein n=1 Tax=Paenibacillus sp. JSM ZJ436 TaxID=3376190 RepID=UPI0037B0BF92